MAIPLTMYFAHVGASRELQVRSVDRLDHIVQQNETIISLLEVELRVKGREAEGVGAAIDAGLRYRPSAKAQELAKQISDEDSAYARTLKAIAESRFDDARRLVRALEEEKEIELSEIYYTRATIEYYAEQSEAAVDYCERALALFPDKKKTFLLARINHDMGEKERAKVLFGEILRMENSWPFVFREYDLVVHSYYELARIYFAEEEYEKSGKAVEHAISVLRRCRGTGIVNAIAELEFAQAYILFHAGCISEAEDLLCEVIERVSADVGSDFPRTPVFESLTHHLKTEGGGRSETFLKFVLAFEAKAHGEKTGSYKRALFYLGLDYNGEGRWGEAAEVFQQALVISEEMNTNKDAATFAGMVASMYAEMDQLEDALEMFQRAKKTSATADVTVPPGICDFVKKKAIRSKYAGRFERAEVFLEGALALCGGESGEVNMIVGDLLREKGKLYQAMDRRNDAEVLYHKAMEVFRNPMVNNAWEAMCCKVNLALLYIEMDRFAEAEALLDELENCDAVGAREKWKTTLAISRAVLYAKIHRFADAELALAAVPEALSDPKDTTKFLLTVFRLTLKGESARLRAGADSMTDAIACVEKTYGSRSHTVARLLVTQASMRERLGESNDAQIRLAEALTIFEHAQSDDRGGFAESLSSAARLCWQVGWTEEGEKLAMRSLSMAREFGGPEHSAVAAASNELGNVHREAGRLEEAELELREAVDIAVKVYGEEHTIAALYKNNLACVYGKMGQFEDAARLFVAVARTARNAYGNDHGEISQYMANLAGVYSKQWRHEEAEGLFEEAIAMAERVYGREHSVVAGYMKRLAAMYEELARYEEAELLYDKAAGVYEAVYGAEHVETMAARKACDGLKVSGTNEGVRSL